MNYRTIISSTVLPLGYLRSLQTEELPTNHQHEQLSQQEEIRNGLRNGGRCRYLLPT
jgi:hypothetical protein